MSIYFLKKYANNVQNILISYLKDDKYIYVVYTYNTLIDHKKNVITL